MKVEEGTITALLLGTLVTEEVEEVDVVAVVKAEQ